MVIRLEGPGKLRSSQNARRHGFASTLIDNAPRSKRAELLARGSAGPVPDPERLHQAKAYPADSGSSICSRGVDPAWLALLGGLSRLMMSQ